MEGLKAKYQIRRVDGSLVDPEGMYFVLKLNSSDQAHKAASCAAALAYADAIESDNHCLAKDLRICVGALGHGEDGPFVHPFCPEEIWRSLIDGKS